MIINADDLGWDASTNRAIIRSFEERWISSATLMATMPGFEEACELVHEKKLADHIGVHLCLDAGQAQSESIKKLPAFCDGDGAFRFVKGKRPELMRLDRVHREALAEELGAQIDRCRAFGIPLTHADSHHHMHTRWGIGGVLVPVAKERGIPSVRLSRNAVTRRNPAIRMYKHFFNQRLRRAGLAGTRYFGSVADYREFRRRSGGHPVPEPYEVMVHPVMEDGDEVSDMHLEPMEQAAKSIDGYENAVSYSGARY